ncbi:DUF2784 domain-containing protein [Thalassoglobus sp.]|uniref:DUF2784 domain-containing protein n=1 Tax=Thalassoglobus sp. TaxID=2795869 RepID=UPI003AA8D050
MDIEIFGVLADFVALLHIAYAAVIVIGLLMILLGYFLKWKWIRNPWFRCIHLIMIAIVVYEAWAGITCPLTVWERELRTLAQQPFDGESLIGKSVHFLLFFDAPWWVFTTCYSLCGALVLTTLILVPPTLSTKNVQTDQAAS